MTTNALPQDEDQFPAYDVDQHLEAIHSMLRHLLQWSDNHVQRIKDADALAGKLSLDDDTMYQVCVENDCIDARSESVFADAAFSNAIVGALAPLYEGIFNHEFRTLKVLSSVIERKAANHRRCNLPVDQFFDPYLHVEDDGQPAKDKNIWQGTTQILKGLGVIDRFPQNFNMITEALFLFRNRGLHYGLEWLPEARLKFATIVNQRPDWKRWFSFATSDGVPWIVCVTEAFMEEAFAVAVETVNAFTRLLHETRSKMSSAVGEPPEWSQLKVVEPKYTAELEGLILQPRHFSPIRDTPPPAL